MLKSYYKRGFTLIEAVMVIVFIAVIAAVVFPRANISGMHAALAANKIKSDIRYAQGYAISSQKRTRIDFNSSADSYSVYYENTPSNWVLMTDPAKRNAFTVSLASSGYAGADITAINFGGSNYGLVFDASGTPYGCNPAGGATTKLSSQGSVTLSGGAQVTVEPVTGKVSQQ